MTQETVATQQEIEPGLDEQFQIWQEKLARLESEMPALEGNKEFPEWWYQDAGRTNYIGRQIKEQGEAPKVPDFLVLYAREQGLKSKISGFDPHIRPIEGVSHLLGTDVMGDAFRIEPEDGIIHATILDYLSEEGSDNFGSVLSTDLDILTHAYNMGSRTDLLSIKGDDYSDRLHGALKSPNVIRWMRYTDQQTDLDSKWGNIQESQRNWIADAIVSSTGLTQAEASDYAFSVSRNGDNDQVVKLLDVLDHFGSDRIRKISANTGIHGLECYSIGQLEIMEALFDNPAKMSKELSSHDVTAVLVNRFGDHNGVMRETADNFDDDNKRTLFFEITTIEDIYRHMISLRKIGVEPSTLVLAAHSNIGSFSVADLRERNNPRIRAANIGGKLLMQMINSEPEIKDAGLRGISIRDMSGVPRLVDEYMKPSRAIDDDTADLGRKKVIFQACQSATESVVKDLNLSGDRIERGTDSVVSQLGKSFETAGLTNIDIYGAPDSIQLHRNDRGVHYSSGAKFNAEGDIYRPHLNAVRIRLENGKLQKQEVEDIVLRKAS